MPERLAFAAQKSGAEPLDITVHKDVVKRLQEIVPGGLDVAIDCGVPLFLLVQVLHEANLADYAGTFREPKSILHKVQKTLMLETDVPETVNEMLMSTRKMGRVGLIGD